MQKTKSKQTKKKKVRKMTDKVIPINGTKPKSANTEMEKYITGLVRRAEEIAKSQLSIEVQPEHLMSAVLEHLASAYVFNKLMSAQLSQLMADMEALRRAVQNDKKDEIQA